MKIKILCVLLMTSLLCTLTACKETKKEVKIAEEEFDKQAGDKDDDLKSNLKRLKKEVSDVKDLDF